jgi:hypothetical protein
MVHATPVVWGDGTRNPCRVGWWHTQPLSRGVMAHVTPVAWGDGTRNPCRVGWWHTQPLSRGVMAHATPVAWGDGTCNPCRVGWWHTQPLSRGVMVCVKLCSWGCCDTHLNPYHLGWWQVMQNRQGGRETERRETDCENDTTINHIHKYMWITCEENHMNWIQLAQHNRPFLLLFFHINSQ